MAPPGMKLLASLFLSLAVMIAAVQAGASVTEATGSCLQIHDTELCVDPGARGTGAKAGDAGTPLLALVHATEQGQPGAHAIPLRLSVARAPVPPGAPPPLPWKPPRR